MRPLPHRAHLDFVRREGWDLKGTARSKVGSNDHSRYTLTLATGEVLYTRVSHGTGQIENPDLIADILRAQLRVSEKDFWACVKRGVLPPRPSAPASLLPAVPLDAKLLRNLIGKVGLTPAEAEALTKEEAVDCWQRYLAEG
jgi:hypothetical protein